MSWLLHHSDEQLLTLIRVGDEAAFEVLFDRHWKQVHRLAYRKVKDHEAAKEIVQDFFIKVWSNRETLFIESFKAYLYTSIKHRCLNYFEKIAIQHKYNGQYQMRQPSHDESTSHAIALSDLQLALEKGIEKIPAASKEVFKLSRLEGKSAKEIASLMNVSEKAIEYHLTRSLKVLRLYLKEFIFCVLMLLT